MKHRTEAIPARLLFLTIVGYACVMLWSGALQLLEARETLAELQSAAETLRRENAALRLSAELGSEEERMERIAREQLGLAYPNEIIIYITGD